MGRRIKTTDKEALAAVKHRHHSALQIKPVILFACEHPTAISPLEEISIYPQIGQAIGSNLLNEFKYVVHLT